MPNWLLTSDWLPTYPLLPEGKVGLATLWAPGGRLEISSEAQIMNGEREPHVAFVQHSVLVLF